MKQIGTKRLYKDGFTLLTAVASALLQCYAIQVFMNPCHLISSGFTGVAQLINLLTEQTGFHIETSLGILLRNARSYFLDYPYLLIFPAVIVSLVTITFYLAGNAFSDAADPRNHV